MIKQTSTLCLVDYITLHLINKIKFVLASVVQESIDALVDVISLPQVSSAIKTTLFPRSPMLNRKCIDSYIHVCVTEPVHRMHVPLPSRFALPLRPDLSYLLTGEDGNIESSAQSRHRVGGGGGGRKKERRTSENVGI